MTDEQIVQLVPYARKLARWFASSRPLDPDDAAGIALLALVEAARRYRPGRGATLRTFAHYRILGALRDEVRRLTGMTASRDRRQPLVALEALDPDDPQLAAAEHDLDDWLDARQELARIRPRDARIAYLRALGYEQAELAAAGGVTFGRISQIEKRGRRRLREMRDAA